MWKFVQCHFLASNRNQGCDRWLDNLWIMDNFIHFFFMLILFWLSQIWPVTLRIQEEVFSGCTVLPDSKETELGGSDQEASPASGKNTGVVLVPCSCMEVRPCSYFQWCEYFRGPWVSFVMTDEFSVRVTKN